jgi:hypothetical protein
LATLEHDGVGGAGGSGHENNGGGEFHVDCAGALRDFDDVSWYDVWKPWKVR